MVIGAGWAGIRATETLLDAGIDNILVLEASNYIGGRSKSQNLDDSLNDPDAVDDTSNIPYDLGSEWLYSGTSQYNALVDRGLVNDAAMESMNEVTVLPMKVGQFYQQKRGDDGELTTEVLEDAQEWMDEIWYNGFHRFRNNRLDELEGMSYEGENHMALCSS